MSGTTTEHAADEAAGEEIFTSEGRDPPIVTSPPPLKQPDKVSDDDKALLETTGLPTEEAFEVFAGKLYPIKSSSSSTTTTTTTGVPETPWQRLARLQREAQELEHDLTSAGGGGDSANVAAGGEPLLLQAVRDLQGRLSDPSTVSAFGSSNAWQERLTQQVADSIASVGSMEGGGSATSLQDATATTPTDWEARIRKLEKLVGTGGGLHESHSLLERLTVLERAASKLSEKDLEVAMKKAKVIRQDLEAASKAKNKLISSRDSSAESSKSIAALHDQMIQLQGMTKLLPVLVQRLQALASQHSQATTWSQRLAATEQQASQLRAATTKIDASLKQMEDSLKTTAEQMTENMKALDAKLS